MKDKKTALGAILCFVGNFTIDLLFVLWYILGRIS